MSGENPELSPQERFLEEHPEFKEGPPLSWYYGGGPKKDGITKVHYTEDLTDIGDGEVGRQLDQWDNYRALGGPGNIKTDSSEVDDPKVKAILVEAEQKIKELTGFSPREINDRRRKLHELFKGKNEGPFQFELHETRETS